MNDTTTSPRRLYRSTDDRKLAGVSGGLGDYFGIDPVLFRLGFVLATAFGGVGLLGYVIAWLVLPERTGARGRQASADDTGHWSGPVVIGAILIVIGVITLLDSSSWLGFDVGGGELFWPLALVGGGAWLLLRERDTITDRASDDDRDVVAADTDVAGDEVAGGGELAPYAGFDDVETAPAQQTEPAVSRPEPSGPSIVRLTLGVLLVYFGTVALGGLFDWWNVDAATVVAVALLITGVGMVASAFLNRRGWPLLLVGLVFGFALVPATVIDVPLNAGAGEERIQLTDPSDIDDRYEYGFGQFVIDLRDLGDELVPGEVVELAAELGAGQLKLVVPDDVVLDLDLEAGIGEAEVELVGPDLGRSDDGWGAEIDDVLRPRGAAEADGEAGEELAVVAIDARVGFGQVKVTDVPD